MIVTSMKRAEEHKPCLIIVQILAARAMWDMEKSLMITSAM